MKRFFGLISLFVALTFLGCFIYSNTAINLPPLISSTVASYRMYCTLLYFFECLPSVLFAGSVVILCALFSADHGNIKHRFSQAMYGLYKKVFVFGLIMVAVLTFISQICAPLVVNARTELENRPTLFYEYMDLSRMSLYSGDFDAAYSYAARAIQLDHSSDAAEQLYREAEISRKSSWEFINTEILPMVTEKDMLIEEDIPESVRAYSALELIDSSKKAGVKGDWFAAHYYAQLAVKIASFGGVDINLKEAQRLAAEAWNKLSAMEKTGDLSVQQLFATKRQGYEALMRGDALQAYYIFNRLLQESKDNSRDPDIIRYFALAKERLEKQYFFIDEAQNLERFESIQNMYFKIVNADSSITMVFARGVTDMKNKGNLVRYIRNLTICRFTADNHFMYSLDVPSAKLLAIEKDGKKIPYILLKSMDRYRENLFREPRYYYAPDLPAEEHPANETFQMLEMPYDDLNVLATASRGVDQMDLMSLIRFAPIANKYGYSQELALSLIGNRLLYPFAIFILFFFFASFAWNYRLSTNQVFKFKWLFIIPLLSVIMYFILESLQYLFKIINFVVASTFGQGTMLFAAFIVYILLFSGVSVLFLSRTE
ncbi:MAG: hypothetical protein K6E51_01420 [Treponema sp.]|nr:hypothetical protein [Treponema sp.]